MTARFDIVDTPLPGLRVIVRKPIEDARGSVARLFCRDELAGGGFTKPIAQINHSLTRQRGAVRGLHFQFPPHRETKLVSCLKGRVFDVAVDLRADSPTFLRWHGEELSPGNRKALCIPEGFAHGFQALEADSELLYLHTEPYVPQSEGALNVNDPKLAIAWPLPISEVSDRDRGHPHIGPDFRGVGP